MAGAEYEDDKTIQNDAIIWRRVSEDWASFKGGELRPSTGAFQDSANTPMSATLAGEHDSPEAYLAAYPNHGLVAITAGRLRQLGQKIVRCPTEADPAHLYIDGDKPKGRFKRKLQKEAEWVVLPRKFRE